LPLAVIGIFDFVGTVFAGWPSDRYDNRWLLFWFYGLCGLSLIYLSLSGFSVVELSIFAGHQLGAATAAFGAGVLRTVALTYMPALYIAGIICVIASMSVLCLARPKPVAQVA
jgi:hypothetical protein